MNEQQKIYSRFDQHEQMMQKWNNEINIEVVKRIHREGIVFPHCHMLYYSPVTNTYDDKTSIHLGADALRTKHKKEESMAILKQLAFSTLGDLLALKFVAEGTVNLKDIEEKMNFLLITFETPHEGRKFVYSMDKQSFVNEDGSTAIRVSNMQFDKEASLGHDIPLLEELIHILRPNWLDKRCKIYN